jgi:hypothetical protein
MKMTFNGRTVQPGQLGRAIEKSALAAVDKHIKSAARSGVRLTKTRDGYKAEGSKRAIERMIDRLGK